MLEKKENKKLLKKLLRLYAMLYSGLFILEVNIKKHLVISLRSVLGSDWLIKALENGQVKLITEEAAIIKRRKAVDFILTDEIFVDQSSLGFWVELFNSDTYKNLKGAPILAFTLRPKSIKRADIYRVFKNVKELRNDLYHHRMIFMEDKEKVSSEIQKLSEGYQNIIKLLSWLNPEYLDILPKNFKKKANEVKELLL